jgi:hypothetical protein
VIVLQDLGLYGISLGDVGDIAYCSANDGCTYYSNSDVVNTPYAFHLLEKQYATSYVGEAIIATFSVATDATGFDKRFEYRYAIVPGVCTSDDPDPWECTWNDQVQMDWTPDYLYYDADTETYQWLMWLPPDVTPGEHYLLSVYGYDHWNTHVTATAPGIIISIKQHPVPNGDNLFDMYGAPNCDSVDCTFYSNINDFQSLADQYEA